MAIALKIFDLALIEPCRHMREPARAARGHDAATDMGLGNSIGSKRAAVGDTNDSPSRGASWSGLDCADHALQRDPPP